MENEILQFSDKEEEPQNEIKTKERRVYSDKSDRSIYELSRQHERGNLELQPEFQRLPVWDNAKSSRLIESVFLEVPIPIIYLSEESDGKYSVIDGQQRLNAFFNFLKNELKLNNLIIFTELNNKKFRDIPKVLQDKFERSTLRIIEIRKESDPDVKFEIFERLNTGAVPLNSQELRNCIYRGNYNKLLKNLSEDKDFQFLLGLDEPHYRMYDRELILRFFAFYRNTERNYNPSMKRFLNQEMEQHQSLNNNDEYNLRKIFRKSVRLSKPVFGDKAFRRFMKGSARDPNGKWETNKINKALFDVIMYGFTRYEENQVVPKSDSIREALIHLMTNDDDFLDTISTYTDNRNKIQTRFEKWLAELKEIVGMHTNEPRCFDLQYKRQLWQSDPTCAICGQKIHLIDDGEIDHVNQYWRGGHTIPSNARLTHRYCNRSRNKNGIPKNVNYVAGKRSRRSGRRTRGGIIQSEFRMPILEALIEHNGQASRREAHEYIYKKLEHVFNEIDLEVLSDGYTKRFEKNIDYQRLRMTKEGLLKADTPNGIWAISEKGMKYIEENEV